MPFQMGTKRQVLFHRRKSEIEKIAAKPLGFCNSREWNSVRLRLCNYIFDPLSICRAFAERVRNEIE